MKHEPPPLIAAEGLTKRFGSTLALDDASFAIAPGARHALLGENGAGKSTLVRLLYGALRPDSGAMLFNGRPFAPRKPADALRAGVGMVFQHFSVFDALTVLENLALALPGLSRADLRDALARACAHFGLPAEPDRRMGDLSVGEKQRVEILRCLMQRPRLLILDEPTSVLTPQEADTLFDALRLLSEDGVSLLYISHRLEEVRALCSEATILRRGRVVWRGDPRPVTTRALAELMVGASFETASRRQAAASGKARLALNGLSLPAASPFGVALEDIRFEARAGEVLGVAGQAGEGQAELFEALSGERAAPAGRVFIDGRDVGALGPQARRALGAGFAPEERHGHAAIGALSLTENLVLTHHGALTRRGLLDRGEARRRVAEICARFDVRGAEGDPPASALSGGNLQKFVIGREIARAPGLLVVSQPSWGVDAAAAAAIRRMLIALARGGAAVVAVSQDLDEIMEIADRVSVLRRGRMTPPLEAGALSREDIGALMLSEAA